MSTGTPDGSPSVVYQISTPSGEGGCGGHGVMLPRLDRPVNRPAEAAGRRVATCTTGEPVTRPRPRSGEPHRRPHRLHRRAGAADGDRPGDDGRGRAGRRRRRARRRPTSPSRRSVAARRRRPGRGRAGVGPLRRRRGRRAAAAGRVRRARSAPTCRSAPACRRAPRSRWRSPSPSASTRRRRSTLARLCQRAEHRASGVPCGIMDQLASAAGVAGHALLIDCHALTVEPVPLPDGARGRRGRLGPGPPAGGLGLRRAAGRVRGGRGGRSARCATPAPATEVGDRRPGRAGAGPATSSPRTSGCWRPPTALRGRRPRRSSAPLVQESHASLRDDFEVSTAGARRPRRRGSTPTPGVHGARLTGAGFGGCVVALAEPGALDGWGPRAVVGRRRRRRRRHA